MAHTIKILSVIGVLLSLLWLVGCSSPAPTSTPTIDLNPFRTEVAATVLAQVTQSLALTPSITPIPSPTATTRPTRTPTQATSASPSVTSGVTSTLSTGTPIAGTINRDQWVSQTIADDTVFAPGETFSMTWRLKNVGTSTWTAAYMLRFFSGDAFGAPKELPLGREVRPGEMVDISLQMKAPEIAGKYRSDWVMSTENRNNFREPVFLKITVAAPITPTRTPTLTPTRTPTP
jgi:Ig-like domain from next to BRCA1 gene